MKFLPLFFAATLAATSVPAWAQISTFPVPPTLSSAEEPASNSNTTATPAASAGSPDKQAALPSNASAATASATAPPAPPPVTAAMLTSMTALDDKVALEAGDTVSFRVIEDREVPVSRVVTDTGEVDFPYIGRVKVEGKTCHTVAFEVKKLLEVDYYKQATVILGLDLIVGQEKTKPHDMAWVMGRVKQVGPFELVKAQPMTVSQLIMRAGGFGDFADQRKVKVIHRNGANASANDLRDAKDFQIIDVKSVFDGKSTVDPAVKAGDYIIVPKKWVNI